MPNANAPEIVVLYNDDAKVVPKVHSICFKKDEAALPSVYVPNETLEQLGYAPGRQLEVMLRVVG